VSCLDSSSNQREGGRAVTFVIIRLSLDLNEKMVFTLCFVSLKDLRFFMFIWSSCFSSWFSA
jgi:hypothetical protein